MEYLNELQEFAKKYRDELAVLCRFDGERDTRVSDICQNWQKNNEKGVWLARINYAFNLAKSLDIKINDYSSMRHHALYPEEARCEAWIGQEEKLEKELITLVLGRSDLDAVIRNIRSIHLDFTRELKEVFLAYGDKNKVDSSRKNGEYLCRYKDHNEPNILSFSQKPIEEQLTCYDAPVYYHWEGRAGFGKYRVYQREIHEVICPVDSLEGLDPWIYGGFQLDRILSGKATLTLDGYKEKDS